MLQLQWSLYSCSVAFFHFSEFFVTAVFKPDRVSYNCERTEKIEAENKPETASRTATAPLSCFSRSRNPHTPNYIYLCFMFFWVPAVRGSSRAIMLLKERSLRYNFTLRM